MARRATAERIFLDGTILTMNDDEPEAEAVAIAAGTILAVGGREEVLRLAGAETEIVSLQGTTLVPGFIDGHSHLGDYTTFWGNPGVEPDEDFGVRPQPPPRTHEERLAALRDVQLYYASKGVTTAQDGLTRASTVRLLRAAEARGLLQLDVVAYPQWSELERVLGGGELPAIDEELLYGCELVPQPAGPTDPSVLARWRESLAGTMGHLKLGGVKLVADGSLPGRTAYLSQPYLRPPPGQDDDYRGDPVMSQDELERWIDAAYAHDVQVQVHCNGDAAADMMIAAVRKAQAAHGRKDLRPVMVHALVVREDQLDAMHELGIFPSFFTAQTYYWGDWHLETIGPERALDLCPTASARRRGMAFSNHTDAPDSPPDQLMTAFSAVNRLSRTGEPMGVTQRLTPLDALKAVTIWAAHQHFEEDSKGSIEPGKRADLVVLSDDPLTVAPGALRDLRILVTIKDGRAMYVSPMLPTYAPPPPGREQPAVTHR